MTQADSDFEFQRLHGMGERLHDIIHRENATRCRIYAPVGAHRDLLAYLVRRLLENGANSSFVNQIVNSDFPANEVAADPFETILSEAPPVPAGPSIFAPERTNSEGFDLTFDPTLEMIGTARAAFEKHTFSASPLIACKAQGGAGFDVSNPAKPADFVGKIIWSSPQDIENALQSATKWDIPAQERAAILTRASDLYEENFGVLFALLAREAGKNLPDAVGELREAVDFLRYYASQAGDLPAARGVFTCISPWNFPLAIFTGQIAGALAAGNGVLAKPAEQTGLIADVAVRLLHQAGVPRAVLQLLPGDGPGVGAPLTSDSRIAGVAFTGSTETALLIRRNMAQNLSPEAPLIAETGGLNAMIIDSTALPEQAVGDVIASAFQSAGQRCSALRCLYVQEDIADDFTHMLSGAMRELAQGDPWHLQTDLGPVIDAEAHSEIAAYIETARREGRIIAENTAPETGHFIAPTIIRVSSIKDLEREVFGPVLHLATFRAEELEQVLDDINATGYGLTFGLHTRIDDRVQEVIEHLEVGNAYVNRNQIGAVVGSQPFGGEGLSGTGPKAGGPAYLRQFCTRGRINTAQPDATPAAKAADIAAALNAYRPAMRALETKTLPGPTGEMNRLSIHARAPFLCFGPGEEAAHEQVAKVMQAGGTGLACNGLSPDAIYTLPPFGGAIWWGGDSGARILSQNLANRPGQILPLLTGEIEQDQVTHERHLCVDTTASGGNAALIAQVADN